MGCLGVPAARPSGKRRNGGDRWPSIPNYITRRGATSSPDGPAWGTRAPLCFMFDDKLFCWRIMVIAIMSNDIEPLNDSQSQAVKFLLKNWIQFKGLDCYTVHSHANVTKSTV